MSTDSPYTFDKLTHSGLGKFNAKDNKEISLSINVFSGNVQFTVFTGGGGRPTSITLQGRAVSAVKRILQKMIAAPRPCRQPVMLRDWNADDRQWKQIGQIGFGIDDTLTPYIDISHTGFQGQQVFLIRSDPKFDLSSTDLSEKETLEYLLDYMIDLLTIEATVAKRLSSFKRPAGGGGGGNRGNWGGNSGGGSRGGGNNSGGGNYSGGNSGGGGNQTINDDLTL